MAKKTKREKDFEEAVGSNVGSAIVNLLQSLKMKDGGKVKMSDKEFQKESKKQIGKKLKRIEPKFDNLQDEIIDIYEGKKKTTDPSIKGKKSAKKYFKGRGKGKAEAFEEHFGPGSMERLLGGRSTKIPKNMRGGGVAMRGFGRANYSNKDI